MHEFYGFVSHGTGEESCKSKKKSGCKARLNIVKIIEQLCVMFKSLSEW
jgi:hypothetical protein